MSTLVYLYILIGGYNSQPIVTRTAFPTFQGCLEALNSARYDNSQGNESENAVIMFCGGEDFQERFNSNFWKREVGNLK